MRENTPPRTIPGNLCREVYLVRHGRAADLLLGDFLLEVLERDVGPHVAAEIDQDHVDALDGVEQGGEVVVVL